MSDQFLGEVRIFPFNFPPVGWAFCDGQLLAISQNSALFSVLGTNFGGNGTSNFGLPNFPGLAANGLGQGPGLPPYVVGETGGEPTVTLNTLEMPGHVHPVNCLKANGDQNTPVNNGWAEVASGRGSINLYAPITTSNSVQMRTNALLNSGGNQPHNNMAPYLVLNFCIALSGIYPEHS
jgi:microcystin-dependent protein